MHGCTLLQQRNGFFAKRAVVVDQGQFLAFELVKSAFFLGDGLHDGVGCDPVGAGNGEVPFEDGAIRALAAAIAHGHDRYFVDRRFFGDGKGRTRRQWLHKYGAAVLALEALIALYAARRVVTGFALFIRQLYAIDAATGVDQLQVVHIAVGPWHTIGRIGPGAVGQYGNELLFGLGEGIARE